MNKQEKDSLAPTITLPRHLDPGLHNRRSTTKKWRPLALLAVVACIHFLFQASLGSYEQRESSVTKSLSEDEFDWYALPPSEDINWVPCFDGHKCARLSLPLDYLTEEDGGPRTEIALRMVPATDKENYLGPILVNPGGPGGSGTEFVALYGKALSAVLGPRFDILGFDPRGTGATTPSAQCFDTEAQKAIWDLEQGSSIVGLNTTDGSIPYFRARETLIGQRCTEILGGSDTGKQHGNASEWGVARFMSSASVATDMLRITQKMGLEKLQYIGYSYGTVLGQYFSAMYPDKIGRLVIDGVFDADDYRDGGWSTNLEDTEAVFDSFATFCHQAGPLKCPVYEPTVEGIQNRVSAARHSLAMSPIPIPVSDKGPFLFTEAHLVGAIFLALYAPLTQFPTLASTIIAIETRNTSGIAATFDKQAAYECECKRPQIPWQFNNQDQALHAIACSDAAHVPFDKTDFDNFLVNLTAMSPLGGPIWANIHLGCNEWPIRAKWRFEGAFEADKTSHPIFVLSPSFDPVCPISHARRVQGRFKGAGLLEQHSYGHCTIAAPSLCTVRYLREYLVNGTLPAQGTVCEPDAVPFVGITTHALSAEDQELLTALKDLSNMTPLFSSKF